MAFDVHLDGLTLSVASVKRSLKFYSETLGFEIVVDAAPDFALVRVGGKGGGTIGLLALNYAVGRRAKRVTPAMRAGAHVELSTSNLDGLYEKLKARGVEFDAPPHDEPWERLGWARDPDGYTLEFAQGERTAAPKARKRKKGYSASPALAKASRYVPRRSESISRRPSEMHDTLEGAAH